ncbi:MAG TPA: hypothetical protein VH762_13240, partial [Gemmatimonadaceae bacterium]
MTTLPNERTWSKLIGWFGLLVLGQAASLTLIRAGRIVSYQHYMLDALWSTGPRRVALVVLVVQTIVVLIGLRGAWSQLDAWRRQRMPLAIGVFLLLLLASLSAAPSFSIGGYVMELAFASVIQLVARGPRVW